MKYCESKIGRVFVIRLEDGEILHESIESFARKKKIRAAALIVVGGADKGSKLVVGPEKGRSLPVTPLEHILSDVHEITGVGTIFPNAENQPVLHMHIASGRKKSSVTGCVRRGVKVWYVMEVILWELLDCSARRLPDKATGFELLQPRS